MEVEYGGSIEHVVSELRAAGLSSRTSQHGYLGYSQTEWVVKSDGSVSNGGELVSPPLDYDDPAHRSQLAAALASVVRAGGNTVPAAGVHVHIGASDLTAKQVAGVARSFTRYEDCIYRIASSGWRTIRPCAASYAKPLPRSLAEKLSKAASDSQLRSAWYGDSTGGLVASHGHASRYFGLNLHSWFLSGTIEFRVFNSTLNPKRLEAYVVLCMALVQDARDGSMRSISRSHRLGSMAAGVLSDKKALHQLCQMLRWENDTHPITKEELAMITYCWKNSVAQHASMLGAPEPEASERTGA